MISRSSCDHRVSLTDSLCDTHTHEQFTNSNFASKFAKELLGTHKKQKAWQSFKTTAKLWSEAFTQQTSVGYVLSSIHSLVVGEFFIPYGCWDGNFSTAIVEAHHHKKGPDGKPLISQGEMKELIVFAFLINQFARHIPRIESQPGPSRSDPEWRWKNGINNKKGMTPEWANYSNIYQQTQKKYPLMITGPTESGFE